MSSPDRRSAPSSPPPPAPVPDPSGRARPWTLAIGTNRQIVGWYRSVVEQPRYASLRTRAGRRVVTAVHTLVLLGLAAQFVVGQRWPTVWFLAFLPLIAAMMITTGLLHAVTFGMIALDPTDLDERQLVVRGEAHRRAHRISTALLFVVFVGLMLVGLAGSMEHVGAVGAVEVDLWLVVAGSAWAMMTVAVMPAYVLAWSRATDDPDLE